MSNQSHDAYFEQFTKPVRRIGRISLAAAILLSFAPALYIAFAFDAMATSAQVLAGFALILSTEGIYYALEPITYYPILGEGGTYMSFLSGSIGAIRVPTVTVVQNTLGTEMGTQKAELVSCIAIAASVLCSCAMAFVAVMLGNLVFFIMPPFVQTMFSYVVPALYGVLIMMYVPKKPIVAVFGLALALVLRYTSIIPPDFNMLVTVLATVCFGLFLAKREQKANTAS